MPNETMQCEQCGEDCCREEVDIGVGTIYGPWGCPSCGWSEWDIYTKYKGFDQYGNYHPPQDPTGEGWAAYERELGVT